MKNSLPQIHQHWLYQEKTDWMSEAGRTPFLLMKEEIIRQSHEEFQAGFEGMKLYYALKANPHWRVAEILDEIGAGFEVSSRGELTLLLEAGIPSTRIISSNPMKDPDFIAYAHANGVSLFALDSYSEIEKLAQLAPGSEVYVRLTVSNEGSRWPLSRKFGVETEEAVNLLLSSKERGLKPCGITFHVGSQCVDTASWVEAIKKTKVAWDMAKDKGLELSLLNLGGGFPVKYTEEVPPLSLIAKVIKDTLRECFSSSIEVIIEPGRALVGEAGILSATVIGKAVHNGEKWLYLDVGVFNGLMESLGGITYPIIVEKESTPSKHQHYEKWVLAGPSCDSLDIISNTVELPKMEVGDRVYLASTGAYTTAYASRFNGIPIPNIHFL